MSGLFGGKPAVVTPPAPTPMPDNQSPAVLEAQKTAAADAMSRAGRASTIITDANGPSSNKPGTDNYSQKTLGAGG